jgi:16S rRNA C1402 (ribose-2'-O) methylase RsmI
MSLIALEFAQPFLITYAISYVSEAGIKSHSDDVGYQLVATAIIIYTGIAVSGLPTAIKIVVHRW